MVESLSRMQDMWDVEVENVVEVDEPGWDGRNELCCNSAPITIDHPDDREFLSPHHAEAPDLCLLQL